MSDTHDEPLSAMTHIPHEIVEEVLAEMKRGLHYGHALDIDDVNRYIRDWAIRIEAAAERERDEDRQLAAIAESDEAFARCARCDRPERATGNAAALREALEKIRHEYGWGLIGCRTCVSSEADVERVSDLFEKQIDAALSAPCRNCDRAECADVESAWATYCAETNRADCKGFARWFFAPAAAEGGDHA